jgi:hypothetical protein
MVLHSAIFLAIGGAADGSAELDCFTLQTRAFMFLRRVYGVVVAVLMLHLTLVGADLSCVDHSGLSRAHHGVASGHRHHAMAMSSVGTATSAEQPCRTPAQPQCCRVMASCTVNVAVARVARLAGSLTARPLVAPGSVDVPQSAIISPDPPPPKA